MATRNALDLAAGCRKIAEGVLSPSVRDRLENAADAIARLSAERDEAKEALDRVEQHNERFARIIDDLRSNLDAMTQERDAAVRAAESYRAAYQTHVHTVAVIAREMIAAPAV